MLQWEYMCRLVIIHCELNLAFQSETANLVGLRHALSSGVSFKLLDISTFRLTLKVVSIYRKSLECLRRVVYFIFNKLQPVVEVFNEV